MSAGNPGEIVPITSAIPIASAPSELADTIAAIGTTPPSRTRSMNSSALRPCAPATASVPNTIFSPGVFTARCTSS